MLTNAEREFVNAFWHGFLRSFLMFVAVLAAFCVGAVYGEVSVNEKTPACCSTGGATQNLKGRFQVEDIIGKRFGRLVVECLGERAACGKLRYVCKCDCGKTRLVHRQMLLKGGTKSCGCLRSEMLAERSRTHGHTTGGKSTKIYRVWATMIQRCTTPTDQKYYAYGARGIRVCERWMTFENFLADMGERPEGRSLDRIDNDGNYEPGNCRWATNIEQAGNTRQNRYVVVNGTRMCVTEAARVIGVKMPTLSYWIKRGIDPKGVLAARGVHA